MRARVNGRAIEDYKRFDVLETGLAVPRAEPLYKEAISNGYAPNDFIVDSSLVLYLPLYLLKGSKFKSVDRYQRTCEVTGALWRPNHRYFDGIDDIIALPLAFDTLTDLTLEMWLNIASGGDSAKILAGFFKDASNRFNPFIDGTTQFYVEFKVSPSTYVIVSDAAPVTGQWYHLSILLGTGGMAMTLDGVRQADTDVSTKSLADIAPMTEVQLGKYTVADAANVWKGQIGETWLYSRRLALAETQHNRNATMWRYQ